MKKFIAGLIVGACMFFPITAFASIPGTDGNIHACRNNLLGTVRIIDDTTQSCNGLLETPVNWPATRYTPIITVRDGQNIDSFTDSTSVTLTCESNEKAIGANFAPYTAQDYALPSVSYGDGANHWYLTLVTHGAIAGTHSVASYAVSVNCLS